MSSKSHLCFPYNTAPSKLSYLDVAYICIVVAFSLYTKTLEKNPTNDIILYTYYCYSYHYSYRIIKNGGQSK